MVIYLPGDHYLGHVRRCLKVTRALKARCPDLSILLLTGSAYVSRYPHPKGVDFVRLPELLKTGPNSYKSAFLGVSVAETLELRQNLIYQAVKTFNPQLMLVDHHPVGVKGELHKTLTWLKEHNPQCQVLLGMRDIIDEPETVLATESGPGNNHGRI